MEDINQNFEQLRRILVKIGYPHSIDKDRTCAGITTELLPLLHYGLLSHSKALATFISDKGYSLYRQNDLKFTEGIYKLSRTEFKHNPILQCSQFLTDKGFAKRKIQFVVTILKLGINKHNQLIKQKKLSSQAKVSWKQTNLAKKVDKVIKNSSKYNKLNNMDSNSNRKPPKMTKKKLKVIPKPSPKPRSNISIRKNMTSPPPKSIIPREIHVESPINDDMEINQEPVEVHTNDDSLTVDEIRANLPEPVPITVTATTTTTQPQSVSTQNGDTDESENDDGDDSDVNKENEEEEKAMELTEDNQSIQIPQHQYDMQLIPEYDPNKYASPKLMEKVNVNGNGVDAATDDVGHYSASYLDAYSTLMDMPQSSDEDEEEEDIEQQHHEIKVINMKKDANTETKQQSRPKIIVLSNRPKTAPQEAGNKNGNENENGKGDDNDTDNDNKQDQDENEEEEEYEANDEQEEHQQSDNDGDEEDDDEEEEEEKDTKPTKQNEDTNDALLQQLKKMERTFNDKLSVLETKVDSHVSLLNVRYKSLEDRITRLEQGGIIPTTTVHATPAQPIATTTSSRGSIGTNDPKYVPPASHTPDDIKRDSPKDTVPVSALAPRQVPTKKFIPRRIDSGIRSQVPSFPQTQIRPTIDSGNGNGSTIPSVPSNGSGSHSGLGGGWSETTVGSASIPVSYQGPSAGTQFVTDNRQNVIQSTIKTYPHHQPRIATSPFLSQYQRPAMGTGIVMRTGMSPIPNIHSPSVTLSNQSNGGVYGGGGRMGAGAGTGANVVDDNPDNTMQFIQDLKKMLSQTDELLKSNRERTGRQY